MLLRAPTTTQKGFMRFIRDFRVRELSEAICADTNRMFSVFVC